MQKIAQGELPQPPMGQTLGFKVVEAELGKTVFEGQPNASHYNPIGSVHGGFAFTLLDSAMACAVHTKLDVGVFYTTLEMKARFHFQGGVEHTHVKFGMNRTCHRGIEKSECKSSMNTSDWVVV